MRTIALRVNDKFFDSVKESARQTNRSVSQYIRDVLSTSSHPFVSHSIEKASE